MQSLKNITALLIVFIIIRKCVCVHILEIILYKSFSITEMADYCRVIFTLIFLKVRYCRDLFGVRLQKISYMKSSVHHQKERETLVEVQLIHSSLTLCACFVLGWVFFHFSSFVMKSRSLESFFYK